MIKFATERIAHQREAYQRGIPWPVHWTEISQVLAIIRATVREISSKLLAPNGLKAGELNFTGT
jgi:hypothetical protein